MGQVSIEGIQTWLLVVVFLWNVVDSGQSEAGGHVYDICCKIVFDVEPIYSSNQELL